MTTGVSGKGLLSVAIERRKRIGWIGLLVAAVGTGWWWNSLSPDEKCDAKSFYVTTISNSECHTTLLKAANGGYEGTGLGGTPSPAEQTAAAAEQARLEALVDEAEAELNAALDGVPKGPSSH